MEIGSREWQHLIIDGAQQLGIAIDKRISAMFAAYAAELIHWNRKINLTAITDPRDIAIKHFLDSLAPAQFIPDRVRLLDIGSGAGFPGIPLKIFKPSLSVLLIDGTLDRLPDDLVAEILERLMAKDSPWTLLVTTGRRAVMAACQRVVALQPDVLADKGNKGERYRLKKV